jgi:NAD(P) transhydrogenase
MMLGDETGMFKLLFNRNTLETSWRSRARTTRHGNHSHRAVRNLAYGGKVDYFRDTVFNYPTLAEAYKVAALDGLNKL